MKGRAAPVPGSRGFVAAVVAAQVLTQIGAFALPALLPGYIERWHLSKTEAGWLVGIFFAAYVPAVPVLLALTDRVPARRIYLVGTGLTALSHLGFALVADGFWSGLAMRALAGVGWAGAYMPGLKAVADPLEGAAQSRAVSWHAAGVGVAGAVSFAVASLFDALAGPSAAFLFGGVAAAAAFAIAAAVMPRVPAAAPGGGLAWRAPRLPPGAPEPAGDGLDRRLHGPHLGACRAARLGGDLPRRHRGPARRPGLDAVARCPVHRGRAGGHRGVGHRQRNGPAPRAGAGRAVGDDGRLGALAGRRMDNGHLFLARGHGRAGVERRHLPRQFGAHRRDRAGFGQAPAGRHDGAAQHGGLRGGFLGPLGVGLALDLSGGDGVLGWGLAFGHLAVVTLAGLVVLRRLGRLWAEPVSGP